MADFDQESVLAQLRVLGIPVQPGEVDEITTRLGGYISHLEELRELNLEGVYPMDTPPVTGEANG